MFRNLRIKYASKFGKIEHKAGRLIGVILSINLVNLYFFGYYADFLRTSGYGMAKAIGWMSLLIWVIYLTSHTFEKKIYGKQGFR